MSTSSLIDMCPVLGSGVKQKIGQSSVGLVNEIFRPCQSCLLVLFSSWVSTRKLMESAMMSFDWSMEEFCDIRFMIGGRHHVMGYCEETSNRLN